MRDRADLRTPRGIATDHAARGRRDVGVWKKHRNEFDRGDAATGVDWQLDPRFKA